MSKKEQLQKIANLYFEDRDGNATAQQIAAWAIEKGLWQPERSSLIKQCAHEIAAAMAEEYYTDPQGRRVRVKHSARIIEDGVQQTMWDDIRTIPRKHMEISVKQRRRQIVGELVQIKTDLDSYNENRCPDNPIQLVLDMTRDVAQIEAAKAAEAPLVSPSPPSGQQPSMRPRTGVRASV